MKKALLYILLPVFMIGISCNRQPAGTVSEETNTSESAPTGLDGITALINIDTSNAILYQQRAMIYLSQRDHNKAMRDMLAAIQLDPGNASYLLTLSDIYLSMGLLDNCAESLNKALELDPENTESMLKLSEIHLIRKNYREAIENADKAIVVDKSNPLPYFIKGYIFAEAGDTVNAIKNYLEAIDRNQEYYDAYMQLGLIYSTVGNRIAIDYFNNALNIDPQSIEAIYALAMFYQQAGDAENAIAAYNKLILLDPQNVYANYNLGYVHLVLMGDFEQAIDFFDKALALKPDYFEAIYNLGYCYELLGDYDMARNLYKDVLELEVNYEKAIAGLNRIYGK